jgi:CHAT domain-containing protein
MFRLLRIVAAGCLPIFVATCQSRPASVEEAGRDFVRAVTDLVEEYRPFELLLSPAMTSRPCPGAVSPDTALIPRFECAPARQAGRMLRDAARLAFPARELLGRDTSHTTLRAASVLELVAGSADAVERAWTRLDEIARRDSLDPLALRDAATAHAVAAAERQDAGHLLLALDLIERAHARDSLDPTVRFNRALLLEHTFLVGEAAAAWDEAIPSLPNALRENARSRRLTQSRLDRQIGSRRRLELAAEGGTAQADSLVAEMVQIEPETVREVALDQMLPAWGKALVGGQLKSAGSRIAFAVRTGTRLAAESGDSGVLAAVNAIQAGTHPKVLAIALAAFGEGRRLFDRGEHEMAAPHFRRAANALGQAQAPVALWGWPALYLGAVDIYSGQYARADRQFAAILRATQATPFHALRARALWGWGLSLARQDDPQAAIDKYVAAIALFAQARERSNVGVLEGLLSDMYALTGDWRKVAGAQLRAARAFAVRRDQGTLQGLLQNFAAFELAAGRYHSALAILREGARVSRRTGRNKDVPEALGRLAAAEILMGRREDARRHLVTARLALDSISSPQMRQGVEAEVTRVEARLRQATEAIEALNRVTAYYASMGLSGSLAPTLVERADVHLAAGDSIAAERDLDSALALVQRRADRLEALSAASSREVERGVFERRIALRMNRGDSVGALTEIDRQRSWRSTEGLSINALTRQLGGDQVILAFAALPRELFIWVTSRDGVRTQVVPITARALAQRVNQLAGSIARNTDQEATRTEQEALWRTLIGPVEGLLRNKRQVTIVADPLLAGLPFAALRNSASARFLIEDHVLQYAFGLAEAVASLARPATVAGAKVLIVGNPSFDRSRHPDLQPLRHSGAEVDSVKSYHASTQVLRGAAATRKAIVDRLQRVSLFHFSGHALSNRRGIRGSRLVLAPANNFDDGILDGNEISGLRLSNLRLVILSACETLTQGTAASYRLDGLAEAFLAAGTAGVIGSSWTVDDEGTTRLMARIHHGMAAGMTAAEALRRAQLAALNEPGGAGSGLRTWSAFRFITR